MRTKMRLKLLAAGIPTATSPDGADPARPGRPRRTLSMPSRSVSTSHHQKIDRLTFGRQLEGPSDIADIFLLVVDPELLVDCCEQVGNRNRIAFHEHALLVRCAVHTAAGDAGAGQRQRESVRP